jgi:hypothetical protein
MAVIRCCGEWNSHKPMHINAASPRFRFSATVGEEPEIEVALV